VPISQSQVPNIHSSGLHTENENGESDKTKVHEVYEGDSSGRNSGETQVSISIQPTLDSSKQEDIGLNSYTKPRQEYSSEKLSIKDSYEQDDSLVNDEVGGTTASHSRDLEGSPALKGVERC